MTKHATKSKYLFYSKTSAAKEWKYTVMERRPGVSQDVEEIKVEMTLLSSDYEVKAVSKNLKSFCTDIKLTMKNFPLLILALRQAQ
jgi:hypothetical protein